MQTLARLFGRSPFTSLQTHMEKVASCVRSLEPLIHALEKKDYKQIERLAEVISTFEHEADLVKNEIRNQLSSGIFMPIARASLLELLSLQDSLADHAQDAAVLLTLQPLTVMPPFHSLLQQFLAKNLAAFEGVVVIIKELSVLLESSFGGYEASRVAQQVDQVAVLEHEADLIQRDLLKAVFSVSATMDGPTFFLWMRFLQELASLSDEAERLANRVRMLLEVK